MNWKLDEAITPDEFAKHYGWSPRAVRSLARDIGACRIVGNRMVLTAADVDAILEAAKPKPRQLRLTLPPDNIIGGGYPALLKLRKHTGSPPGPPLSHFTDAAFEKAMALSQGKS